MSKDYSTFGLNKTWVENHGFYDKLKDQKVLDDGFLTLEELEKCELDSADKEQLISDFLNELGMSWEEYEQFNNTIEEETQIYEDSVEPETDDSTTQKDIHTTYWSNGSPREIIEYNTDGSVARKETYEYGTGNIQSIITYDSEGEIASKSWYKKGKEQYTYEYNSDGSYTRKTPKEDGSGYDIQYFNEYGETTDKNGNVINTALQGNQTKADSSDGSQVTIDDATAEEYAKRLYEAMDGPGTDDSEVCEVMSALDGADLVKVAQIYEQTYGGTLIDAIKGDFSFGTKKTYVAKVEAAYSLANRDSSQTITESEAKIAIEKLYKAMKNWGTDEEAVSSVINSYCNRDLKIIAGLYEQTYGKSLEDAIKDDFSGNAEKVLLAKLNKAMQYTE